VALDLHSRELSPSREFAAAVVLGWSQKKEGLATILVSFAAYFFIQNYPSTAKFLTDKERTFIQARLAADSDSTIDERFTWGNVMSALTDYKCWLYGFAFHTTSLPLYTYSLFLVGDHSEQGDELDRRKVGHWLLSML
jgi:hypothetical protein